MKKVTIQDVEPLIEETRGNIAAIGRKLGVSRGTVWNRCNESATLMQALTDARESMLDNAESMLYKKVLEGSTIELLFFLKTQGRNRGYVERQEVSGANGGPIEHIDVGLTDTERVSKLNSLLDRGRTRRDRSSASDGPDAMEAIAGAAE